jgi:hypothetical protein
VQQRTLLTGLRQPLAGGRKVDLCILEKRLFLLKNAVRQILGSWFLQVRAAVAMRQKMIATARIVAPTRKCPLVMESPNHGFPQIDQRLNISDGQIPKIDPVQMQDVGLLNGGMKRQVRAEHSRGKLKPHQAVPFEGQEIQALGHEPAKGRLFSKDIIGEESNAFGRAVLLLPVRRTNQHRTVNSVVQQRLMQPLGGYGRATEEVVGA